VGDVGGQPHPAAVEGDLEDGRRIGLPQGVGGQLRVGLVDLDLNDVPWADHRSRSVRRLRLRREESQRAC
jgi:hypothetical protein